MINQGVRLFVLSVALFAACVLACSPDKGCPKPSQLCVRVNSLVSKCAAVSGFHTFCDVNHKDNCAEGDACDVASGKCYHASRCSPACAAPNICKKVWMDAGSKYMCAPSGDCGGCAAGYKCLFGRMCLRLPVAFNNIVTLLSFVVENSADLLGGFFTGKVVAAKDADSAAPGDMIQVTDEANANIKAKDNQTIDARAATAPNSKLSVQTAGASASDVAAAPTLSEQAKYDNNDNYNPDALPVDDETLPSDEQASTQRFIHLHARRVRRQDYVSGLKALFFGLYKVTFSLTMAAFDSAIFAFDAACSIVNKCHMPVDSTLKLGGTSGPLAQMEPKHLVRLQEEGQVAQAVLPRKFTGDGVRDGSANIDFMGALNIQHHPASNTSEHSLGAASVTLNNEVTIDAGATLTHSGTVTATDPLAKVRVKSNGRLRYSGSQFAAGLHVEEDGAAVLTSKGAQVGSVTLESGATLKVQTYHLAQMPGSEIMDGLQTASLNDSAAVRVSDLKACEFGARVVLSLRGGALSALDVLQGYVLRFDNAMNDSDIWGVECTATLEDKTGKTYDFIIDPLPLDITPVFDDYSSLDGYGSSSSNTTTSARRPRSLRTQSVMHPRQRYAKLMHYEWLHKRQDLPRAHHVELARLREWHSHKATRLALMDAYDGTDTAGYASVTPNGLSLTFITKIGTLDSSLDYVEANSDSYDTIIVKSNNSVSIGLVAAMGGVVIVAGVFAALFLYKLKQEMKAPAPTYSATKGVKIGETEMTAPAAGQTNLVVPPSPTSAVRPPSPSTIRHGSPAPRRAASPVPAASSPTHHASAVRAPSPKPAAA